MFDHAGVASVREKRLALEGEARGDTPPTPAEDKVEIDYERQRKEVHATHTVATPAC
jgi:hypothetical protein